MIDVSKIRVGDEVMVKGTVRELGPDYIRIEVNHDRLMWLPLDSIDGHVPKPRSIAVGDTVILEWNPVSKKRYIVKAIDEGVVWLKDPNGSYCQFGIKTLVHADDPS